MLSSPVISVNNKHVGVRVSCDETVRLKFEKLNNNNNK